MSKELHIKSEQLLQKIEAELGEIKDEEKKQQITRFIIAAMSSIPWIGGFFGATASLKADLSQSKTNDLIKLWIEYQIIVFSGALLTCPIKLLN